MIDRIKKNKKILTGLALFMVLALLLIAIHSWDEDTIKSMLKDKVTFVNLPNDDEEMLKKKIIEFGMQNLSKWSVPKIIEFIDALPRTKIGKVDFKVLK